MQLRKAPDEMPVSFFCLIAEHHVYPVSARIAILCNYFRIQCFEFGYLFQKCFKTVGGKLDDGTVFQGINKLIGRRIGYKAYPVAYPVVGR